MVKELKKELTKLSGVDFFNPKYRDVFKRYFPNDNNESDVNDNEEDRLNEIVGEESLDDTSVQKEESLTEPSTDETEEQQEEQNEEQTSNQEESFVTEENKEIEPELSNQEENLSSVDELIQSETTAPTNQELLETRIELELIKAGIREDRVEAAKKLFLQDIHGLDDLGKVQELINRFPEWKKKDKSEIKPFGMPIGDVGDGLTEEEKRLKAMGIDPRA